MTLGDYRDGSGISFTPRTRRSARASRVAGALLVLAGLTLAGFGVYSQQTSIPARATGVSAVGVLTGYEPAAGGGGYAIVEFPAGPTTHVAHSVDAVPEQRQKPVGAIYQVKYAGSSTFIEGLDPLTVPWDIYFKAGVLTLGGLALTLFPVKLNIRAEPRRQDRD